MSPDKSGDIFISKKVANFNKICYNASRYCVRGF